MPQALAYSGLAVLVPDRSVNLVLLDAPIGQGYKRKTAVTARTPEDGDALEKAGANVAFRPYADAADRAAEVLTDSTFPR